MAWVRLDDSFTDHPKLLDAGLAGIGLQVSAICYANRHKTDGFISDSVAARLSEGNTNLVQTMVALTLWDAHIDGYQIHDYLEFQPSRFDMERKKELKAGRQQRWRETAGRDHKGRFVDASTDAHVDPFPTQPNPSSDLSTTYLNAHVVEQPQSVVIAKAPRERRSDSIWDTLMAVCRVDTSSIPKSRRGAYNRVVSELRTMGATPELIIERAVAFRLAFKGMSLTPTALLQRWAEVEGCATQPEINKEELEIRKWINS